MAKNDIYDSETRCNEFKNNLTDILKQPTEQQTKRGHQKYEPQTKTCVFCNEINKCTNTTCQKCNRPLDRTQLIEDAKNSSENEFKQAKQAITDFITKPEIMDLFKKFIQEEVKKAKVTESEKFAADNKVSR